LEKILNTNRASLEADESHLKDLASRKGTIEIKKQEVEMAIMRGLANNEKDQSAENCPSRSPEPEPDRPEVEALTPPPIADDPDDYNGTAPPENGNHQVRQPAYPQSPPIQQQAAFHSSAPGIEMLSILASQYHAVPVSTNGSNKRRRVASGDEFPDLGADDGINADVAEMLRKDRQAS
jgi:regulator of Ty1 transposition protein 103